LKNCWPPRWRPTATCAGQIVGCAWPCWGAASSASRVPCPYHQLKQLIVFIEMDRCTGDAVAHVTGVKLGRRSLKFADYGIMAATFINLKPAGLPGHLHRSGPGFSPLYAPQEPDKPSQQLAAYRVMPDSVSSGSRRWRWS